MRVAIVFLKSDKSVVIRYADCPQTAEALLSANNFDETHDAVVFESKDIYEVSDYEIDAGGNPVLMASADTNVASRIKASFSSTDEFKAVRLAFKSILAHAAAGDLNTTTLADLANDIEADW